MRNLRYESAGLEYNAFLRPYMKVCTFQQHEDNYSIPLVLPSDPGRERASCYYDGHEETSNWACDGFDRCLFLIIIATSLF